MFGVSALLQSREVWGSNRGGATLGALKTTAHMFYPCRASLTAKVGCIIHLFLLLKEVVPRRSDAQALIDFYIEIVYSGLVHSPCMIDRLTWCHRKRREENSQI